MASLQVGKGASVQVCKFVSLQVAARFSLHILATRFLTGVECSSFRALRFPRAVPGGVSVPVVLAMYWRASTSPAFRAPHPVRSSAGKHNLDPTHVQSPP